LFGLIADIQSNGANIKRHLQDIFFRDRHRLVKDPADVGRRDHV